MAVTTAFGEGESAKGGEVYVWGANDLGQLGWGGRSHEQMLTT